MNDCFVIVNRNTGVLFRKDKMTKSTAVLYLTRDAAEHALSHLNKSTFMIISIGSLPFTFSIGNY